MKDFLKIYFLLVKNITLTNPKNSIFVKNILKNIKQTNQQNYNSLKP